MRRIRTILGIVLLFIVVVSFVYVMNSTSADKGRPYYEETGQIVWDIQTDEKMIALTFDDGPHPVHTREVVDLLTTYDAKGTFFVVGEHVDKNPEITLRIHEEGHELANHTYTHPFSATVPRLLQEIERTNQTIFSLTGYAPTLFRPVEGQYTDELIEAVSEEGYQVVMWSWHQDTEDWKDPGVEAIVEKVLTGAKQGDVILFHDGGSNRQQTVQALAIILPKLQKEGYHFVTVSELLKRKQVKNKP